MIQIRSNFREYKKETKQRCAHRQFLNLLWCNKILFYKMIVSTNQILLICAFNGGVLLIFLVIVRLLKLFAKNNDITVDQESQENNTYLDGQRPISIIRTLSLPTYENAITCQKVETPPPKYLELFFTTKSSSTALDSI